MNTATKEFRKKMQRGERYTVQSRKNILDIGVNMCYALSMFSRLLLSKFKAGAAFHSYFIGYRAQSSNAHL